jgi:hypothetical protein
MGSQTDSELGRAVGDFRIDARVTGDRRSIVGRLRRHSSLAVLGALVMSSAFVAVAPESAQAVMIYTPADATVNDGAG